MSPIRSARGRSLNPADDLSTRVTALEAALLAGSGILQPEDEIRARILVTKVAERTALSGDHTVVALAGATGSGKSSLFNALVGSDVATIGARRPTTSRPTAALWGDRDAGALLDWLKVDARHVVDTSAGSPSDGSSALDGLVLLDLPDFDSRQEANRVEAERVLELVDVFVWVTDPQKYADARLHDDFVRLLSQHEAVTLAVLNQEDRLPPEAVDRCAADLGRLLARDGIRGAVVLTTSVPTGAGIPELKRRIAESVAGHAASRRRLSADVITVARYLREQVADTETDPDRLPRRDLDTALGRAAGVPIVLDAVARDYRREAVASAGWLFTRWTGRMGRNPLNRLRLGSSSTPRPSRRREEAEDVSSLLARSSIPAASSATQSAVDLSIRAFARSASAGLPVPWVEALNKAAGRGSGELPDALDQAVLRTSLQARRPVWWSLANFFQWLFGLAAIAGLLWLLGLYVLGLLAIPRPETPSVGVVPVPVLLIAVGLLLGIAIAGLARWWASIGARRRRAVIAGRLRTSIAATVEERIVTPVTEVLDRHRRTREGLDRAGS